MAIDKQLKADARALAAERGISYTAARRLLVNLEIQRGEQQRRPDAAQYEVLGRVLTALFAAGQPGIMTGARHFRFWRTGGGAGFSFDWDEGPHRVEVLRYLDELDPEAVGVLKTSQVTNLDLRHGSIDIDGIEISLRAIDTLGHEEAVAKSWRRTTAADDDSHGLTG